MKKQILMSGMVAMTIALQANAATNYDELRKELEIMDSVLVTAFRQSDNTAAIRFRGLETSYLAGQGVVFEINTSRRRLGLDLDLRRFIPRAPEAPTPPVIIGENGDGISIEITEDWEHMIEDTMRNFEEVFREAHEQMRDVRSDARELEWEARELERRQRDLNFELRSADKERKKELEEELKEIRKSSEKLQARKQELNEYADTLEAEQKAQVEKQREARLQADKAFLSAFEERVGDTLCRFGSGIRALPKNEHISFVLKQFDVDEKRQARDRVYVFTLDQVKSCVQERIDANKLLSNATIYSF
ncbi:hypothetical protein [Alteromonas flava]|uniref:hypothetical protein n=1 Tax=Alteromonas flava TaxID=2048003 RepID=UPI000F5E6489|nr:hypothetical protein [Alteromonas flava]